MSNKKPSELAVWNNDKTMVVHAHKPGVSQKVSIQDIIDAVPVPELPELPEQLEVSEKGKELVALETVQAMKEMLEVSDIEASDAGKDLIALETVAAMKEMLEVPEAGEGGDVTLQESFHDETAGRAMLVGGFGWGVRGSSYTVSEPFAIDVAMSLQPSGLYHFYGNLTGTMPKGVALGTSSRTTLLNVNSTSQKDAGFQILCTNRDGNTGELWVRRSLSGSGFNVSEWKDILATPAPLHDEVGSLRIAKVDPARLSSATTNSLGFIENIQGSYLVPHNFNGQEQTQAKRMSGRWTQVTYCVHDSEDILATLALWRRIA